MSNHLSPNEIDDAAPSGDQQGPERVDWDNIAIAVPHDLKTRMIVVARNRRLTLSEWGRGVLTDAVERAELAGRTTPDAPA